MIYLIFSPEGFDEAKNDIIDDKATLWINNNVLSDEQQTELTAADITLHQLPEYVTPTDEKGVVAALEYVEKRSDKNAEILVEYN
jgi:hypothetical protein